MGALSLCATVLPFGLALAPYVLPSFYVQLVKLWRSRGLKSIMYLDDGMLALKGKEGAEKASGWVKNPLLLACFVVN